MQSCIEKLSINSVDICGLTLYIKKAKLAIMANTSLNNKIHLTKSS